MRRIRIKTAAAILAVSLVTAACGSGGSGLISGGGGNSPGHHVSNVQAPNHKASSGAPKK